MISGTPTQVQESTSHEIKFSCTLKEIPLQGSTEINIQINGPQSIVCSQIEDKSIVVNESFSLGVANVKMEFNDGTQKSVSSNDVTYELLDSDGQSAASTLPQGLSFNTSQGKISGTVTSLNYYAPTTYKIKIIGSARIGSKVGYSNTFTLSMENNPLPDTVYNVDTNNTLLGFKEGVDLNQYDSICNTMQIPVRVTSIAGNAFLSSGSTTIPPFITKLTFAEGSNCSTIGQAAFAFSKLTSLILPSALTTVQKDAFASCFSLISADLSKCNGLEIISQGVFYRCRSLTSITIMNQIKEIHAMAFNECSILDNIIWDLPSDYQTSIYIASRAFADISSTGTVTSLNTSIASSQQLLEWIKTKGDFPSSGGWRAA